MEYKIGLLFHMFGLSMIAGGFLGGYLVEKRFWKLVEIDISHAGSVLPIMKTLPVIIQVGVLIQVISGTLLLQSASWAFWGQAWLSIKLILVALALANGLLVGKKLGAKIGFQVFSTAPDKLALAVLKKKMISFNLVQLALTVGILVLATVFR
jgi:hypothetical protein